MEAGPTEGTARETARHGFRNGRSFILIIVVIVIINITTTTIIVIIIMSRSTPTIIFCTPQHRAHYHVDVRGLRTVRSGPGMKVADRA